MSPNEFQLRDALHDGEGDVPDADRAIGRALRFRQERRRRITAIASAAVVVAVVGVGGTLLVRSGSNGSGEAAAGGGSRYGFQAETPGAGGGQMTHGGNPQPPAIGDSAHDSSAAVRHSAASVTAADVPCPAQAPHLLLPGGGGTNQFGGAGQLFSAPVAAMRICAYDSGSALADSRVLDATAANDVATQLEAGSLSVRFACPVAPQAEGSFAIYAVTPTRQQLPVVTVDLVCPFRATNGTALRFVSPSIAAALDPSFSPSPNEGSPPR
jgi:hypothetical protein